MHLNGGGEFPYNRQLDVSEGFQKYFHNSTVYRGLDEEIRDGIKANQPNYRAFLVGLIVLVAATRLSVQQAWPDGVKFEVISVRVLNDKEAAQRSPDFVGPNVAIRLRLSTTARESPEPQSICVRWEQPTG